LAILSYSQSGDDPQQDLAKFGEKLKYGSKICKTSFYVFGYVLEVQVMNHVQKYGDFS
jgi:hypothetical protein